MNSGFGTTGSGNSGVFSLGKADPDTPFSAEVAGLKMVFKPLALLSSKFFSLTIKIVSLIDFFFGPDSFSISFSGLFGSSGSTKSFATLPTRPAVPAFPGKLAAASNAAAV